MEKISVSHRHQPFTRARGIVVFTIVAVCYVWFGWQLYVSPLHMALFAFFVPAAAWIVAVARNRRTSTVLLEVREIS